MKVDAIAFHVLVDLKPTISSLPAAKHRTYKSKNVIAHIGGVKGVKALDRRLERFHGGKSRRTKPLVRQVDVFGAKNDFQAVNMPPNKGVQQEKINSLLF